MDAALVQSVQEEADHVVSIAAVAAERVGDLVDRESYELVKGFGEPSWDASQTIFVVGEDNEFGVVVLLFEG